MPREGPYFVVIKCGIASKIILVVTNFYYYYDCGLYVVVVVSMCGNLPEPYFWFLWCAWVVFCFLSGLWDVVYDIWLVCCLFAPCSALAPLSYQALGCPR